MLIYCHGFGSSGQATKAQILREQLRDIKVVAPDLPLEPFEAIKTLLKNSQLQAEDESRILLVGSSLGGFYALHLHQEYGFPAILLNSTVDPIGDTNRRDQNSGDSDDPGLTAWCEEYTAQIKALYHSAETINPDNLFVFLNRDDELLDYQRAAKYFKVNNCQVKIFKGGGHRFMNFVELIPTVRMIYAKLPPVSFI